MDDYSSYSWIYPMKTKIAAFKICLASKKLVENLFNTTIKYFQSDGDKEYDNTPFFDYLVEHGIYFRKSSPHI